MLSALVLRMRRRCGGSWAMGDYGDVFTEYFMWSFGTFLLFEFMMFGYSKLKAGFRAVSDG